MRELLVFSDDWGRHPSSCQHLVRAMLPEVSTTWVNTIGMRPPRMDWITLRRGAEKLQAWAGSGQESEDASQGAVIPDGLTIVDAKMWPWMKSRWDRWCNRQLLVRQLRDHASGAIGVTTIPIVADLIGELPVERWVYYCVDDFSVWPGLDGRTLGRLEDELLPKMNRVVAASEALAEGIRRRGVEAEVLTHGVDLDFWRLGAEQRAACGKEREERTRAEASREPQILFWGVVDRRMNADWLLALADSLDDARIVLAGPQQDPDLRLANHARIELIGPVPFESLPALARQASVLVMPYADLPVTRAMQPLKLKEYLATGLPVVAASLPAVCEWDDCLDRVMEQGDFVECVLKRISSGLPEEQLSARRRLENEGWREKSARFRAILGISPVGFGEEGVLD